MKAIATRGAADINAPGAFETIDADIAEPRGHDLRVRIRALAVNPVDTKVRAGALGDFSEPTVLGWDAVGLVEAVGEQVSGFTVGDRVYYAGEVNRPV